jgi:hypothetical protein
METRLQQSASKKPDFPSMIVTEIAATRRQRDSSQAMARPSLN